MKSSRVIVKKSGWLPLAARPRSLNSRAWQKALKVAYNKGALTGNVRVTSTFDGHVYFFGFEQMPFAPGMAFFVTFSRDLQDVRVHGGL